MVIGIIIIIIINLSLPFIIHSIITFSNVCINAMLLVTRFVTTVIYFYIRDQATIIF